MQTQRARTLIAFAVLIGVGSSSYAKQVSVSEPRAPTELSAPTNYSVDGVLIGFSLGGILSSGNAQQEVNQEDRRKEATQQNKQRKKAAKDSATNTSSERAKGTTASGAGEQRSTPRQMPENW